MRKCKSLYILDVTLFPENMDWLGHDRHPPRLQSYLNITRYMHSSDEVRMLWVSVSFLSKGLVWELDTVHQPWRSSKPIYRAEMSSPCGQREAHAQLHQWIRVPTDDCIIGQLEIRCANVLVAGIDGLRPRLPWHTRESWTAFPRSWRH